MGAIIHGAGAQIVGQPASNDFSIVIERLAQSYPAETVVQNLSKTTVTETYAAYSTSEDVVTVTSTLPVTLATTSGFAMNGSVVRKIGNSEANCTLSARSAYGQREFVLAPNGGLGSLSNRTSCEVTVNDPNSIYAEAFNQIQTRLSGKTPGYPAQSQYANGAVTTLAGFNVAENAGFAFGDIDWSMISMASTGLPNMQYPIMLLSPRHAIYARHVGSTRQFLFRRPNGTTQTVGVVSRQEVRDPEYPSKTLDISVCLLDQDVTGCAFTKVPPANYLSVLADVRNTQPAPLRARIPVIARLANTGYSGTPTYINNNAPKFIPHFVSDLRSSPQSGAMVEVDSSIAGYTGAFASLAPFCRYAYGGDSSSPVFLLVREDGASQPTPVMLFSHYGVSGGGDVGYAAAWIQQTMDALSDAASVSRYSLQRAQLNRYL